MTLLTGTECSLPLSPPTSALPRFPLSHPFVLKVKIAHTIIFSLLLLLYLKFASASSH